jgi:hypothetical protein
MTIAEQNMNIYFDRPNDDCEEPIGIFFIPRKDYEQLNYLGYSLFWVISVDTRHDKKTKAIPPMIASMTINNSGTLSITNTPTTIKPTPAKAETIIFEVLLSFLV